MWSSLSNIRSDHLLQSMTSNPHVAEERNINVDDSGANEEDKFVFHSCLTCHLLISATQVRRRCPRGKRLRPPGSPHRYRKLHYASTHQTLYRSDPANPSNIHRHSQSLRYRCHLFKAHQSPRRHILALRHKGVYSSRQNFVLLIVMAATLGSHSYIP